MSRRSASALALLLALGAIAPVNAGTPNVEAAVATAAKTPRGDPAYLGLLRDAATQGARGDTLGAAIAYDRLLVDPRMATLDPDLQSFTWLFAARVAGQQRQGALARERLNTALRLDPHNAEARLQLARHQLYLGEIDAGVADLLQAIADTDGAPDLDGNLVWQLFARLKNQPDKQLALLQALFDHGWKIENVEPMALWVNLAALQVDAGQGDKVAATLERIDDALTLVRLRSDKRFDPYLRRDDPRFDPVAAARRHIDRLRVDTMLSPGFNLPAVELVSALLVAGENDDVVGMTDPVAAYASELEQRPEEGARDLAWMLDKRAVALLRLGRVDDAVNAGLLSVRMADPAEDPVSQRLNLARLYVGLHRPALARQTIDDLPNLSPFGKGFSDLIALRAALQLKDTAAAEAARERLLVQREENPMLYREALLLDNRMDDAAASLIQQLADPVLRMDALFDLQDLRDTPPLPESVALEARYRELKQRADVQAAVRRVGRIDAYPLFGS